VGCSLDQTPAIVRARGLFTLSSSLSIMNGTALPTICSLARTGTSTAKIGYPHWYVCRPFPFLCLSFSGLSDTCLLSNLSRCAIERIVRNYGCFFSEEAGPRETLAPELRLKSWKPKKLSESKSGSSRMLNRGQVYRASYEDASFLAVGRNVDQYTHSTITIH
jgi:hypothetical protein